jgi:hypothetical protein
MRGFTDEPAMTRHLSILVLLVLLFGVRISEMKVRAANWYVDNTATGSNNGTNWANAWVNPTNIVWTGVNPGDTIFVSGGTTNQIYTNNLVIGADGTPGNYITVRIGQDSGHNGVAIFDGCRITMGSYPQWVAIDGGRSASFVAPANHQQVITGSTAITNNIGFWIRNLKASTDQQPLPSAWYLHGADHLRFSYIEVSGLTNTTPGAFDGDVAYAMKDSGTIITNITFEYLYCHDNGGRVMDWESGEDGFDAVVFKFGWLNLNAEDHFHISSGWTIRDSVIGPCSGASDHTDYFQTTGSFIKIYNNLIREGENSICRFQTWTNGLCHDIWFFNNIVSEKPGRSRTGGTWSDFIGFYEADATPCGFTISSNIIFANNLIYNSITNTWWANYCDNCAMSWNKGTARVTNGIVKHCLFVNNLVVDKEKGLNFPIVTNGVYDTGVPVGYNAFTTNDFIVDYNVIAATNAALDTPMRVNYLDFTNGLAQPGWPPRYKFNNTTNYPAFVDKANDNFQLASSDTAAIGNGTNLSSYFTFDSLNNSRSASGMWDRGPLNYQGAQTISGNSGPTNGLLVWLKFDNDFSANGGELIDSSTNGINAWRFGWTNSAYPTNFPVQIASTSTPGRTNLSIPDYCGQFNWHSNANMDYGRDGDYAGITNVALLTNMATASIMCWARYYPAEYGHDWSWDNSATLISAGTAAGQGTWQLARNDTMATLFSVLTNGSLCSLRFPDNCDNTGDTTNWMHYAVTWNNGVIIGYANGIAFQTNDISAVVTRLQIGEDMAWKPLWIGIGCNTHGGTPQIGDNEGESGNYPNNGFFNGVMDDVRIYNRVLSAAEVQAVYSSGGDTGLAAKPSPPTGLMIIAR